LTTIQFIRHGSNDWVGRAIAGWQPNVSLNEAGRQEVVRLAQGLAETPLDRLYSSPLERARETAEPISLRRNLPVAVSEAIGEVRFGDWTGQKLADLELDPKWQQWNVFRSGHRVPNGETMLEIQARFVGFVQQLCRDFPGESIALVSHGDPIRATLLYYLGMPLDFFDRLEIGPASVSTMEIGDFGARLLRLNQIYT
jgi:broad specificity phosphatase PhoE